MKELSAELRKAQEYENKALKEENENKFPVFHLKVPTVDERSQWIFCL